VLLLEQPFKLGDFVAIGEVSGTVEEVALRTTRLRTADNHLAIMPNATVFAANVISKTAYPLRRVQARAPGAAALPRWTSTHSRLLAALKPLSDPAGPPPAVRLNMVGDPPVPIIEAEVWAGSGSGAADPDEVRSRVLQELLSAG
jgi:hypothetical protein